MDLLIDRQVEDTVGLWQEPRPLPHFAYVCIYTQAAHVQTYIDAHMQYTYIHKFPQKQPELTDSPEARVARKVTRSTRFNIFTIFI